MLVEADVAMRCIESVCSCTFVCTPALHACVISACMEMLHHSAWTKQDRWNKRQEAAVPSDSQLRMALMTKDNWRQKNVHTVERSWAIIHRGLAARNKCPDVIDYTIQANEIKRAWIDSDESCQRDVQCSGDIDMLTFQEPAKETNLCFRLRIQLCPLSLHRSASPTTAIRVSTAQIKCKQSDLTRWRLTAETSLLRKPFFCHRHTTSRLWGKKAYFGDTQQACL